MSWLRQFALHPHYRCRPCHLSDCNPSTVLYLIFLFVHLYACIILIYIYTKCTPHLELVPCICVYILRMCTWSLIYLCVRLRMCVCIISTVYTYPRVYFILCTSRSISLCLPEHCGTSDRVRGIYCIIYNFIISYIHNIV